MARVSFSFGIRVVSSLLCGLLAFPPSSAVAQDFPDEPLPPEPTGYTVDAGDALGRIAVRAFECQWAAERDPQLILDCSRRHLQGLWGAFLGDVDLLALAGRESLRALGTVSGFGACMQALGVETTNQVLLRKLERLEALVRENESQICNALVVLWRLQTDPAYAGEMARALAGVIAAHLPGVASSLEGAKCSEVIGPVCEVMGMVTYEVLLTLVLAIVTTEAGGAGGIAKGAQALAKVAAAAKRYPRLASFLEQAARTFALASRRLHGLPRAASFAEHVLKGQRTGGGLIRGGFHTDAALVRYLDEVWGTGTRPYRAVTRSDSITEVFYRTTRKPQGRPDAGLLEVRVEILPNGVKRYHLPKDMFPEQVWEAMKKQAALTGHPPAKTTFPVAWTDDQIMRAVDRASRASDVMPNGRQFAGQFVVDGVKIRFQGINGKIVSAFPLYFQ